MKIVDIYEAPQRTSVGGDVITLIIITTEDKDVTWRLLRVRSDEWYCTDMPKRLTNEKLIAEFETLYQEFIKKED